MTFNGFYYIFSTKVFLVFEYFSNLLSKDINFLDYDAILSKYEQMIVRLRLKKDLDSKSFPFNVELMEVLF